MRRRFTLTGVLVLCSVGWAAANGCRQRTTEADSPETTIANVDFREPASVKRLADLLTNQPELCSEVRQSAKNANAIKMFGCLRALLTVGPSEELHFVVDQLALQNGRVAGMEAVFEQNITGETKAELMRMVRDARGAHLVVVGGALSMVADDYDTLELARGMVARIDQDSSDVKEQLAVLNLLGSAAYFNQAPETTQVFRQYWKDHPSWGLLVIQTVCLVPGKAADEFLRELLDNPDIGVRAEAAQDVLSARKELMGQSNPVAPGWKR